MVISFKKAEITDALMLLRWRNDPVTVKYSITRGKIPYSMHIQWLERVLANNAIDLLIAYVEGIPVGMVRFDPLENGKHAIAIVVAPECRGNKLGHRILASICKLRPTLTIVAAIHNGNLASQKIFAANGFKLIKQHEPRHFSIYERAPG